MKKILSILFVIIFLIACNTTPKNFIGDIHLGMSKEEYNTAIEKCSQNSAIDDTYKVTIGGYDFLTDEAGFDKDSKLNNFSVSYADVLGEGNTNQVFQALRNHVESVFGPLDNDNEGEPNIVCSKKIGDIYIRVFCIDGGYEGGLVIGQMSSDPEFIEKVSKKTDD